MSKATRSLKQLKKASSLVNRTFRKNGPKSYRKGQGALIKYLHCKGGELTRDELVEGLSFDRHTLKRVVRKAQRAGYAEMIKPEGVRGYSVKITKVGDDLAEKRCAAHDAVAENIMAALTPEEIDQLNALTEKIILSCKEQGAHGKRKNTVSHRRKNKRCCKKRR